MQDLLIAGYTDNKPVILQCCQCKRVKTKEERWGFYPIPSYVKVSHIYCEDCQEITRRIMKKEGMEIVRAN